MSQAEVFVPSNDNLTTRDNLCHGLGHNFPITSQVITKVYCFQPWARQKCSFPLMTTWPSGAISPMVWASLQMCLRSLTWAASHPLAVVLAVALALAHSATTPSLPDTTLTQAEWGTSKVRLSVLFCGMHACRKAMMATAMEQRPNEKEKKPKASRCHYIPCMRI